VGVLGRHDAQRLMAVGTVIALAVEGVRRLKNRG
jgi:hypothetical protein